MFELYSAFVIDFQLT